MALNGLAKPLGLGQLREVNPILEFVLTIRMDLGRISEVLPGIMPHHVPTVKPRLEPFHFAPLAKL